MAGLCFDGQWVLPREGVGTVQFLSPRAQAVALVNW